MFHFLVVSLLVWFIFNHMVKYKEEDLNLAFSALADPTRRRILARLATGEQTVLELARPFEMSLPAVSKHLKVLEKARLIDRTVSGRVHTLSINPKQIKTVSAWLNFHSQFWVESLQKLKHLLESEDS